MSFDQKFSSKYNCSTLRCWSGFILIGALLWLLISSFVMIPSIDTVPPCDCDHTSTISIYSTTTNIKTQSQMTQSITTPTVANPSASNTISNTISNSYNRSKCPAKYPKKSPPMGALTNLCSKLHIFGIRGKCDVSNCSKCIPPNAPLMGHVDNDVKLWQSLTRGDKKINERRQQLASLMGLDWNNTIDSNNNNNNNNENGNNIDKKPIIVLVVNHGYLYLFLNWACSVDYNFKRNGIKNNIRNQTLVITTDSETYKIVREAGFIAYFPKWLGNLGDKDDTKIIFQSNKTKDSITRIGKNSLKIDSKAAPAFGNGPHRWTVSVQITILWDLIQMGYDVLLQDIDIIWNRNPIQYLLDISENGRRDILMAGDDRIDNRGPGNSGMVFVRSNCKTKIFLTTLFNNIPLILVGRSDQQLWNVLLDEKVFRQVIFQIVSPELFVNGWQFNLKKDNVKLVNFNKNEYILVHGSYTNDQFHKIEKFYAMDFWFFNPQQCSRMYDYKLLPSVNTRTKRNHNLEQEIRLLERGLARNVTE